MTGGKGNGGKDTLSPPLPRSSTPSTDKETEEADGRGVVRAAPQLDSSDVANANSGGGRIRRRGRFGRDNSNGGCSGNKDTR